MKRYTVPGWPARVLGHSAVTPNLTRMAASGAQQYKDGLTGQPGTQAIPTRALSASTVPGGGAETPSPGIAMMGLSRSSDAREVFFPNLYWARPQRGFWPGAGQPVSVQSDNLMPVRAVDPRGTPARLSVPVVLRGRKQIVQPAALPRWQ